MAISPNWASKSKETRYFRRCLSSPAGFPLGPPDAGRSARRAISKLKGLTLIS
jgi:hypothetical protein